MDPTKTWSVVPPWLHRSLARPFFQKCTQWLLFLFTLHNVQLDAFQLGSSPVWVLHHHSTFQCAVHSAILRLWLLNWAHMGVCYLCIVYIVLCASSFHHPLLPGS
eukprot:GGOE01057041.1.p3 GENE.GGOE01057041.1~~GGOE01057041.1.p3  ORF type:complete len:105 (-),score=8.55 GGOE01057041.1:717-1031(-)